MNASFFQKLRNVFGFIKAELLEFKMGLDSFGLNKFGHVNTQSVFIVNSMIQL